MTRIYRLAANSQDYLSLIPKNPDDWQLINGIDGSLLSATWQPVEVRFVASFNQIDLQRSDFPYLSTVTPVFSKKAWDAFKHIICDEVEPLDIFTEDGTRLILLNVVVSERILDENRSKIVYYKSSPHEIQAIEKYEFLEDVVLENTLFREALCPKYGIYCTERFRRVVDKSDCTGFNFISLS